jgi:hypothetical protein
VSSLQVKGEVMEDVYTSRKKQHQTMMHYFTALNTLQYKKKIAILEPLLGYMQAQVLYNNLTSSSLPSLSPLHLLSLLSLSVSLSLCLQYMF